jgi:hypothetical protein
MDQDEIVMSVAFQGEGNSAIDRGDRGNLRPAQNSAICLSRFNPGFCAVSLRPGRPWMARYAHSAAKGFSSELPDGAELCAALIMSMSARNAAGTCRWPG